MYYLVVGAGRTEHVLCTGTRAELETLARKLRQGGFFRYVRIDASPPRPSKSHHGRKRKPHTNRGRFRNHG